MATRKNMTKKPIQIRVNFDKFISADLFFHISYISIVHAAKSDSGVCGHVFEKHVCKLCARLWRHTYEIDLCWLLSGLSSWLLRRTWIFTYRPILGINPNLCYPFQHKISHPPTAFLRYKHLSRLCSTQALIIPNQYTYKKNVEVQLYYTLTRNNWNTINWAARNLAIP